MIGIYKFTNLINNNAYIGQSIDIDRRYKEHINRAKNINSEEYYSAFHKALRKYGIENFSFEILEECSIKELNNREQYWINYFNTYKNGYNCTTGGNAMEATKKYDIELINLIKDALLKTNWTYQLIHEYYGVSIGYISEINSGKIWYDENNNYPLRKQKEWKCECCGSTVSYGQTFCVKCSNIKRRKVERPTRNELKNLIRNSTFVDIGKTFGVSDNTIKKWCKTYGLPSKRSEIKQINNTNWELI